MRFVEFECSPSVTALLRELDDRSGRFVLENVGGGTAIVGAEPFLTITGEPLSVLADRLAWFGCADAPEHVPFAGGAVGYFSYDLGRTIEPVPSIALEDIPTPDYCLGFYDSALCIDLARRKCIAFSSTGDIEAVDDWRKLALSVPEARPPVESEPVHCPGKPLEVAGNFTREGYISAIERVKDYIAAGDVYQVNLSQRFEADLPASSLALYEALRRINPAPKSCFIELEPVTLVSASPELFLHYEPSTRRVVTRPIKGTRPRGRTKAEDARLAAELAGSPKDRAENVMIVDMERNDLGRVARYGSVSVPKLWEIEEHPNVFQMVSTVEAELAEGLGPVDLLRATFPGGSITGAPKIRAMQIIEELEPHRRGVYTGAAGFIDFRGKTDLNIVIRSFAIYGSRAYFHAGGGIVIDSDPRMEYQETMDKISGLRAALRQCEGRE